MEYTQNFAYNKHMYIGAVERISPTSSGETSSYLEVYQAKFLPHSYQNKFQVDQKFHKL